MLRWKELGFDSQEEWFFSEWCRELGVKAIYKPSPFPLSEPVKIPLQKPRSLTNSHLMRGHTYSCDFVIDALNPALATILTLVDVYSIPIKKSLKSADMIVCGENLWIDVKGGNFKNSIRSSDAQFPLNQKWLWKEHGIYVNSVIPDKLFEKTFYPEVYFWTDTGKDRCKKDKKTGESIPLKDTLKKIKDIEHVL